MNSRNLKLENLKTAHKKTVAHQWIDVLLKITALEVDKRGARPTVISRIFYVVTSAMYEAWAAYEKEAIGIITKGKYRRPDNEHNNTNKEIAISYAAFRTIEAMFQFKVREELDILFSLLNAQMDNLNIDPNDNSQDSSTPSGVGNIIAADIIQDRVNNDDGANQIGDYIDTTNYQPINTVSQINDPNKWQPIEFTFPDGTKKTPKYLTPQWGAVRTFGLERASQFRPEQPPPIDSQQLKQEVEEIIEVNSFMSLERKAIVEIMRDGPQSTSQSGQWFNTANDISIRDNYDLDTDIKLYFSLGAVGLDAFIACWESKLKYNSSRPWTLVHYLYKGQDIYGWGGPGRGTRKIKGEQWLPYSPFNFITPPFPGYVSGHSTVSGATARILEMFTGSDFYGYSTIWKVGSLTEPGYSCEDMQYEEGRSTSSFNEDCNVSLSFPTFTSVAEAAGISRVWGGFHIQTDNIAGLVLGRKIAAYNWNIIQKMFRGIIS